MLKTARLTYLPIRQIYAKHEHWFEPLTSLNDHALYSVNLWLCVGKLIFICSCHQQSLTSFCYYSNNYVKNDCHLFSLPLDNDVKNDCHLFLRPFRSLCEKWASPLFTVIEIVMWRMIATSFFLLPFRSLCEEWLSPFFTAIQIMM